MRPTGGGPPRRCCLFRPPSGASASPGVLLVLAEVAVCVDSRISDLLAAKRAEYRDLIRNLRTAGWRVMGQHADGTCSETGPDIIVLPFGHTGLTYAGTLLSLGALGVPSPQGRALQQRSISRYVTECAGALLCQKWRLQAAIPDGAVPPLLWPQHRILALDPHVLFSGGRPLVRPTGTPPPAGSGGGSSRGSGGS